MIIPLAMVAHGSTIHVPLPVNAMDIESLSRDPHDPCHGRVTFTDGTIVDIANADLVMELMMMDLEDES